MTIPVWPTDLPRPMRQGYSRGQPDGRAATQPEWGPPRVRRRFSAAVTPVTMTIDVSADGKARFARFWAEDTRHGSLPFLVRDRAVDGHHLTTEAGSGLLTDAGVPILITSWMLVMFQTGSTPSETPIGIRWRIALPLSIMP